MNQTRMPHPPRTALALALLCGGAALGASLAASGAGPDDFDAACVAVAVPERVHAGEVFPVAITLRNTGARLWEGWPVRLRSFPVTTNPPWGTDYILIAQGTVVHPGSNYTFRSYLRAPNQAGSFPFQWRMRQGDTRWFGAPTPARTIEVLTAAPYANPPETAPAPDGDGRVMLRAADFRYAGSFKPPRIVAGARGAFSESGLALRPGPGGRPRLLMNYTHPKQVLFEVEIPPLVWITNGQHAALNTAPLTRVWGAVQLSAPGNDPIAPNGGFVWLEASHTLLWTWYHGYKTGEAPPVLGATRLGEDGAMTSTGPWRVAAPGGLYKSFWGGIIALPPGFAARYTGGQTLALGFGGYYSICAAASRGPALGAIAFPAPDQSVVPVTPLLIYPHNAPAPRDGNYFNANCGFWNEQPRDPAHGAWTFDDYCRAGVFIETPAAHGYLAFVRLGTGRLGYDYGTITSAGAAEYWYFYDPRELGEAARGRRQPGQVQPVAMTPVTYPLGRTVTGACFDPGSRRLYVCVNAAYADGLERYPVIHVYRLASPEPN